MTPKAKLFLLTLLLFLLGFLWLFTRTHPSPINAAPQITPTVAVVPEKKGPNELYPRADITPGSVFPGVTREEVCTSGYTKGVRDVPVSLKRSIYDEYGVPYPQASGAYEVDHFIPLELGGDNGKTNLWLEPSDPKPGFHEKDAVENYLHKQVCDGFMDLSAAQKAIQTDWYAVYLTMH